MKNTNDNITNKKNNVRNKAKFIIAWYFAERKKLKDPQKILLLNKWIKSCTQFEEYEMANALLNQKKILVRQIRIAKIGERTLSKSLYILAKVMIRFIYRRVKKIFI